MDTIRLMIVDDHTVVRDGLAAMLERERGLSVAGEAKNGREAVIRARELDPDVILMDLRMPELDGVGAMREILAEDPDARIIVLTTYDTDDAIFDALEVGAKGYLLKDASREELFRAVRTVHQGESLIQPSVTARVLDRLARLSRGDADQDALSERELEVLQLLAGGSGNKEIASSLSVTESTVKTHIANIFQKLGVNSRTEAVTHSLQKGIIKL